MGLNDQIKQTGIAMKRSCYSSECGCGNQSAAGSPLQHTPLSRRGLLQAGAAGVMGNSLSSSVVAKSKGRSKNVLFIFLTGGISHLDTFDMKPAANVDVRGEFDPGATATPGTQICTLLPELAKRTNDYALVRSIGTASNGHEQACHMLLTGRLDLPVGFSTRIVPSPNEWPSLPSQINYALQHQLSRMPASVVLPQPSVNEAARVRPGQYAGRLGPKWETWHIDIASKCPLGNGACPHCFRFDEDTFEHVPETVFDTPMLTLPEGGRLRFNNRVGLLKRVELNQKDLDRSNALSKLNSLRLQAISVLADPQTRAAFEVENADPKTVERYGRNKFGLSVLMGRRLIEAGVRFVQVNLGKNSSWDTHGRNFVNLKRNLLPYLDQCISALLDDLRESGQLDDTLVIVTGEFGRTPKINKNSGRDHWGPVMTSLFAGGGVRGGNVLGATDKIAGYPIRDKYTVENIAATVFDRLDIPRHAQWVDFDGRPHEMYRAEAMHDLF